MVQTFWFCWNKRVKECVVSTTRNVDQIEERLEIIIWYTEETDSGQTSDFFQEWNFRSQIENAMLAKCWL
jgi:hypothetical protein